MGYSGRKDLRPMIMRRVEELKTRDPQIIFFFHESIHMSIIFGIRTPSRARGCVAGPLGLRPL
jgi:hypothetical protein